MEDGRDLLDTHGEWMHRASIRLAIRLGGDQEDCYQILAVSLLSGRSRRLAWLEACKSVNKSKGISRDAKGRFMRRTTP